MTNVSIKISNTRYRHLEKVAKETGKSVQKLLHELIVQFTESENKFDVTQDPVYQMEGYETNAPKDLSKNLDKYLYGEK